MTEHEVAKTVANFAWAKQELREEIERWEVLLNDPEAVAEDDPIGACNRKNAAYMRDRVAAELKLVELAEAGADLELALDGDAIRNHAAPAGVIGRLLSVFQDYFNAVAQVRIGTPSSRGSVPATIVSQHRLMLSPQFVPGSFAVRLRLPKVEEAGDVASTALDTLEEVVATLAPDALSSETTSLLGHARVKSQYAKLLTLLARENVTLEAATRRTPKVTQLTPSSARDRTEWLSAIETRTAEEMLLDGRLAGGDIERKTFHLRLEDGEEITGGVANEALASMKQVRFGDPVRIRVRTFETEHSEIGVEPKVSYKALSFEPLPGHGS